jgi:hypothetical protein
MAELKAVLVPPVVGELSVWSNSAGMMNIEESS